MCPLWPRGTQTEANGSRGFKFAAAEAEQLHSETVLYTVLIQTVAKAAFDGGGLWPLVTTDNVKFPNLKINK